MKTFLIFFICLILLAGAGVGTLAYLGVVHFRGPTLPHVAAKPPEGAVAVPLSFRRIPAYHEVTRDDLIDPKTMHTVTIYLKPITGPGAPLQANQIIGRVMRHEKGAGYYFTENDFFPVGTEPGNAAGIPPGKRAMTIDASKLQGAFSLLPGNHVDLVGSQVIDSKGQRTPGNWPAASQNPNALLPGSVKRATFTVLVNDGVVITPVTQRQSTYMGQGDGLMPTPEVKKKPVQEIMIAMDPAEVPKLTEALAAGAEINCFLHSGQPTTAPAATAEIPDSAQGEEPTVHVVEKIVGKTHNYVYLPSATQAAPEGLTGAGGGGTGLQ